MERKLLKDICSFCGLAVLYLLMGSLSFYPSYFNLGNILIPISILLGWPAILGVTAGSLLVVYHRYLGLLLFNAFGSPDFWSHLACSNVWLFTHGDFLFVVGVFLSSLLSYRIGRKRMSFAVNVVAVIGAGAALPAIILPWWSLNVTLLGQNIVDFTVHLGWFGGNLGALVEIFRKVTSSVIADPFGEVAGKLTLALLLLAFGSITATIGSFLRGHRGRNMIIFGAVACLASVLTFSIFFSQSITHLHLPVTGSYVGEMLGFELVQADWGWSEGIYLSAIAVGILIVGATVHSHMVEIKPSKFLACIVAALTFIGFMCSFQVFETTYYMEFGTSLFFFLGSVFFSFIIISLLGFALVSVIEKLRHREE